MVIETEPHVAGGARARSFGIIMLICLFLIHFERIISQATSGSKMRSMKEWEQKEGELSDAGFYPNFFHDLLSGLYRY